MKSKLITNKTIYNPYSKEKSFQVFQEVTPEDQQVMREYLERTHQKQETQLTQNRHTKHRG